MGINRDVWLLSIGWFLKRVALMMGAFLSIPGEHPSTEGQKSTFFRLGIMERASMYGARIKTIQIIMTGYLWCKV